MVFSSVPGYLDPPNWNNNNQPQQQQVQVQQQQQQQLSHGHGGLLFPSAVGGGGGGVEAHHHHHHQHQQQQQQQQMPAALMAPPRAPDGSSGSMGGLGSGGGGGGGGSAVVKAGSMTDRARMAKIPAPEAGLKCPRCESSNTKFCYFNNYSLTQPRHFCKACRRYWTRGGALRNVPVGGGCRRNKRSSKSSKSSSSSSAAAGGVAAGVNTSSSSSATTSSATTGSGIMPALGQMPFFAASLVSGSGGGEGQYGVGGGGGLLAGVSRGLGFPGGLMGPMGSQQLDSAVENYHHQLGGGIGGSMEQWRLPPPQMQMQMQQFPFFGGGRGAGPDAMSGMQQLQQQMQAGISNYPFEPDAGDGSGEGFAAGQMMGGGGGGGKQVVPGSAGLITQLASVKMEDNPPTAMAREFLGLPAAGSLQFWAGGSGGNNGVSSAGAGAPGGGSGGWVDRLAGFNSSSSGNIL